MAERTIWRVRLEMTERQQLPLPPGSRILSVQRREGTNDQLDLWAEVNAADSRRMFYTVMIVGTGNAAPDPDGALRYVSTVQVAQGSYVFLRDGVPARRGEGAVTARHQVVVDVETTGLDPTRHVPVECAWWDLTTGARAVFIPPHPDFDMQNAEVIALELNGYYDRGLDNPNRWDVDRSELRTLHAALMGQTLAGSNPAFDARFLSPLFTAEGLDPEPWHHRFDDLAGYARGVLGLAHLPGLSEVCEVLGIEPGDHSAAVDVTATGRAFLELAQRRAGLTAAHPHAAVMLDVASVEDCDAVARAAMQLPSGRPVRAGDRAYGRRIIAALTERAAVS